MTPEEWLALKKGDVIVEVRSGIERKVLSLRRVTRQGFTRTSITLRKLVRRAWTPGPYATYFNYDDRGRWRLKR
jgi:hypothetical protein